MDLKEICEQAEKEHHLSQNQLAKKIGLQPSALSHVLNGRRKLPAEAAIELFDLTGIHPKKILEATVRTAACVAVAIVVLFATGAGNPAEASIAYDAAKPSNTNYGGLWC